MPTKNKGHRKKPFSGKKKKAQLQNKRGKRRDQQIQAQGRAQAGEAPGNEDAAGGDATLTTSFGAPLDSASGNRSKTRFATTVMRENDEVVRQRKARGSEPISRNETFEKPIATLKKLHPHLFHPRRPAWSSTLSAERIEESEQAYFSAWLANIHNHFSPSAVTPFEHNLEVWRQLWRVVEQSDVLLITADCRNPLFHISESLVNELLILRKPVVIVITKIDLVPPEHVIAWKTYLQRRFPLASVTEFSARGPLSEADKNRLKGGLSSRRKFLKNKPKFEWAKPYVEYLVGVCAKLANFTFGGEDGGTSAGGAKKQLTIGLCGHPNTGKTSLLNDLAGKKVASVSRTAGHTKYLQHIPLESGVVLIDCPGLIFPLEKPRFMGEVLGLYPIAQIREPFTAIRFAFEHLPLEKLYIVKKPEWYFDEDLGLGPEDVEWTPIMFCEAVAEKRGFLLSRGGAPDVQRAGLQVMKDLCDGVLCLAFQPPNEKTGL